MQSCGSEALSLEDVERIARTYPGTTFQEHVTEVRSPPDTRTTLQKLYASGPKPVTLTEWRLRGRYVKTSGPIGNPQYNGGYEVTFTSNGGTVTTTHDGEKNVCGRFAVAHRGRMPASAPPAERPAPSAPPAEEDEDPRTLEGGRRRRRSRVKKQTRRTQRKRRNTVRR